MSCLLRALGFKSKEKSPNSITEIVPSKKNIKKMPQLLTDMPDVVLKELIENLEFPAIETLRKTCHTFRNFIDDQKPNPSIQSLFVEVAYDWINLNVYFDDNFDQYPDGRTLSIQYSKHKDECHVEWFRSDKETRKIFEKMDYVDMFCSDFELILRNQTSDIDTFGVEEYFDEEKEEFQSNIGMVLPSLLKVLKKRPLPVDTFEMTVSKVDHILQILPCIDSEKLNKIRIASQLEDSMYNLWELNQLLKLDQWKKAKHLEIDDVLVSAGIQTFSSFLTVRLCGAISLEYLTEWKNVFLTPATLNCLRINGDSSECFPQFAEAFGPPVVEPHEEDSVKFSWFFKVRESETLLLQVIFFLDGVCFGYVMKEDLSPKVLLVDY